MQLVRVTEPRRRVSPGGELAENEHFLLETFLEQSVEER